MTVLAESHDKDGPPYDITQEGSAIPLPIAFDLAREDVDILRFELRARDYEYLIARPVLRGCL